MGHFTLGTNILLEKNQVCQKPNFCREQLLRKTCFSEKQVSDKQLQTLPIAFCLEAITSFLVSDSFCHSAHFNITRWYGLSSTPDL